MNALTRRDLPRETWDPFREMEELQSRMLSLFGRAPLRKAGNGKQEAMTVTEWSPLVDIIEDEKEYVIKAELPELKKEDIKVSVQNGVLTLTGERSLEKEEKGKMYHRVERAYGRFERSFTLPEDAAGDKVNAEFKDGVLRVRLAKSERPKPKSIDVKVN